MSEWKHVVLEWLAEYASLKPHEVRSFAAEHEHNHEIATAIFSLLYSSNDAEPETSFHGGNRVDVEEQYDQLLEDVCNQLFNFYRSKEVELMRFTLQFIPTIVYTYLSLVAQSNKKTCSCLETLLIGIYNIEVMDEDGKPKVISFRLPSLAQPSIYHEPLSLGPQFLTESALRRWEDCNTKLVTWGPHAPVEAISQQNRLNVITALLFIYNQQLCYLQKLSLRHFCIAASRIVTQGFQLQKNGSMSSPYNSAPRIPVAPNFLIELVEGSYFAMYNEFFTLASQAVKDIDQRAQYELFPKVMLVTSAVINSMENTQSETSDGPLGINAALSPANNVAPMSKSMITNASFRTKKLPDDIPIQVGEALPSDPNEALTSITEEGESDSAPMQRGGNARTSKPKLSSFSALGKKSKDGKDKVEKRVTLKESTKGIWSSLSGGGDTEAHKGVDLAEVSVNMKDDMVSIHSAANSTETSDSRSQVTTTDSLDMESATPRFAAMQVSSV